MKETEPTLVKAILEKAGQLDPGKRRASGRNQNQLAGVTKIPPSTLSKILKGTMAAGDDQLVRLADAAGIAPAILLLAGAIDRCQISKQKEESSPFWNRARAEFAALLESTTDEHAAPAFAHVTLSTFPTLDGTSDWTVIAGDRREKRPQGMGDIGALSISSSDFMYFAGLSLPRDSLVLSDKVFHVATDESLGALLGQSHLLFIGSPAVSFGTRKVLSDFGATMQFNISQSHYTKLEDTVFSEIQDPWNVDLDELEHFATSKSDAIDDAMPNLMKTGFVDPIGFKGIRGRARKRLEDYGMVAVSINPWAEKRGERRCMVICAGVGAGGTAGSVKLLSKARENFEHHPWGGVFKVYLPDQVPWENRFQGIAPKWETAKYDPKDYMESAGRLLEGLQHLEGEHRDISIGKENVQKMMTIGEQLSMRSNASESKPNDETDQLRRNGSPGN